MNFKYLGLGSLLGVVLFAVLGATVVDRITYFSSTSVSKTNYVYELTVTNGATLGGVRRTSWPTVGADNWTNASSRVRLTTTNANNTLELSADDGAGAGTIEFFTAGSRRWLINNGGVLYPESNSDIGTSVNPVQSLYLGPVGIHIGTNVLTTDLSNPTKPTWNNGVLGNVTSTGASVAGQIPTYTGTDGKSVVPTNGVPLLNVGTLTFTGGAADKAAVFDGSTNLVPSSASTNDLNALAGKATTIAHYLGTDTNALLAAIGGQLHTTALDHYSGTDTNAILGAIGGVAKAGDTLTGPLAFQLGSVSAPAISATGGNTGWYWTTTNRMAYERAGTALFMIDASFIRMTSGGSYCWASGEPIGNAADLLLERDNAAVLQQGDDAAAPIAQTIKAADGSGADKPGGNYTHAGGQSTGTGTGGFFDISTSLTAESTGSALNSYSIRYHAKPKFVALTHTTATTVETFSLAANKLIGGTITSLCYATNATPHLQALTSTIIFQAVAIGSTITGTISQVDGTTATDSGTLTCTYTLLDNGNNTFSIQANANSSLTTPTERCKLIVTSLNGNAAITITDP